MNRGINKNMPKVSMVEKWVGSLSLGMSKKQTLAVLIVAENAISGNGCFTTYQRQHAKISPVRYNKYQLSNRMFATAVDILTEMGFLESVVGDASPNEEDQTPSMFKATNKLLQLFPESEKKHIEKQYVKSLETIVLRDEEKQEVDYTDNNAKRKMRTVVKQLNIVNSEYEFKHNGVLLNSNSIVRVFNEDFDRGGRFYRAAAHAIAQRDSAGVPLDTSQTRLGITIDGFPVVEVDYACLHPLLLCAMYNIDSEKLVDSDIYRLMFKPNSVEADRILFKKSVNIMFNARSMRSAQAAVAQEIIKATIANHGINPYSWNDGWSVVKRIKECLPEFEDFFCREDSFGKTLQNMDSHIMSDIIDVFVRQQKPIIPVHDSAVVREQDEQLLVETMEKCFRSATKNNTIPLTVKVSRADGTKHSVVL